MPPGPLWAVSKLIDNITDIFMCRPLFRTAMKPLQQNTNLQKKISTMHSLSKAMGNNNLILSTQQNLKIDINLLIWDLLMMKIRPICDSVVNNRNYCSLSAFHSLWNKLKYIHELTATILTNLNAIVLTSATLSVASEMAIGQIYRSTCLGS